MAIVLGLSSSWSYAFENLCTHPEMAERATVMLGYTTERYYEAGEHEQVLKQAVHDEDELPSVGQAVINHFYNPRNDRPLYVPGLGSLLNIFNKSSLRLSSGYWGLAIADYRANRKGEAYRKLGRSMHLLQDLYQPAHAHNDAHIPEKNFLFGVWGIGRKFDGHDMSPLESIVEANCPLSVPAVELTPLTALTHDDLFVESAIESYRRAAFYGTLEQPSAGATGIITIGSVIHEANFVNVANPGAGDNCRRQPHWSLANPERPGAEPLCYFPGVIYDGPIGFEFDNDWWELKPDQDVRPGILEGVRAFYIDRSADVHYVPGLTLNDWYIASFVPKAVDRSAQMLKLFAKLVDAKKPLIEVTQPSGIPFEVSGVSDQDTVEVATIDDISSEYPVASGIYKIEIVGSSQESSISGETGEVIRTFSGLADGQYVARVYDGLGNIGETAFTVNRHGGPEPVPPPAPDPNDPPGPFPPPTPGLGVEINANTGASGQACAGPSSSGHKPVCARTQAGGEKCYPAPQDTLCIAWACSSPGTYDIPVNFQDDRGNWARTHTIHCHDTSPKITSCTAGQPCQEITLPSNFNLSNSTISAVIEEGAPYCGSPQACSIIERIGGGKCEIVGFGGCSAIRWSRDYHNTLVAAAGMFYFPPEDMDYLRNQPFTVNFSWNGTNLASFTYPTHSVRGATVRLPALGQPYKNCADDPLLCLAGGGSGGGGGPPWGDGPPPTPQPVPPPPPQEPGAPAPPPDPMKQAAAGFGRAMLGGAIRIGNAATIFGRELTLTSPVSVPPYQPTTGAEICRWSGTTWGCEGPASATCSGGTCVMTANLLHASTWAFLAPQPSSYPDLTAPNSTDIQISENGVTWSAPGTLIQTTNPSVRMTTRDPPSGIELISGIAVSSVPLPFTSSDPSLVLHLHLDEGAGSQLFDSSPNYSTGTINLTPAWAAGRFGSSLDFTGVSGQQASAPVAARVDGGPFSIEAWVYPTNNAATRNIAKKGTAFSRFFAFAVVDGQPQASVGDGNVSYTVTSADKLPLNQWSLVAMSFDGTKLRIFANGEQKGEVAAAYAGSDSTVVIGLSWLGRIDELRILSRAIGRAEAALDYRRGFAVLATGDGWRTTKLATEYDYGGLTEGQAGPAVFTASGFALARSTYAVGLELAVADVDGHISSTEFQVPVAPADTTPLSFIKAEISSNTSVWHPYGAVMLPGPASLQARINDPASGDALRSGVNISTPPTAFAPDPYTQLLLHLDEGAGTTTLDSSARASAVTIQNAPTWTTGRFGGALQFTDDYQFLVPSASPAGLDAPNWTANAWVYPTEVGNGFIFNKQNDARYGFYLRVTGGRPQLNVHNAATSGSGGITITAPDILPLNQWTFLTATSDQSSVRIYVNGVLKASAPGYMDPNSATMMIGAYSSGAASWRGKLDEIRFMSRAQTPSEVLLDYRRGYAALFSSNGGSTWSAPALSYGSAVSGDLDAVLTVSGLTLADSLTSNVLQLFAADAAGNTSSTTYVLPAGVDSTAPASPVIVSTQLAGNGAVSLAWQPASGEAPVSYSLYRATEPIVGLAGLLPLATTSAASALDAPSPALGDVQYFAVTATDLQGNVGAPSESVQVLFDHAAPVTTLAVEGASVSSSGTVFVLPASTLTLSAADQGAVPSLVVAVNLSVDGSPVQASTAPFHLAEGSHQLTYFATDAEGNVEGARVSAVAVDATSPVSTLTVTGGGSLDPLGRMIVVAGQGVELEAQDLPAGGVAVGVGGLFYRLDMGSWTVVSGSVTVPEGQHVLEYYAVDALGNAEEPLTQAFVVALAPTGGVAVASATATSFTVSWSPMPGAAGYVVVVSSEADFNTVAFSTAVETQQAAVTGLQASTTYFIRVAFFSDTNDGLPVTVTAVTLDPPADSVPPVVSLSYSSPSFTSSGAVTIGTQALVSLFATDPSSSVPASGVAQILYSVDEPVPALAYSAPFNISSGTHAIYFSATDVAGNASAVSSAALSAAASPFVGAFAPSSGPIGVGFSMAGFGFGAYGGGNTRIRFGVSTAPVSVWNDAAIVGTVPGLSVGTYPVTVERVSGSTSAIVSAGTYTVTSLTPSAAISSGPIGLPFTLTGPGFGTYAGSNTRVLFGGATAPISVWNDAVIQGTIPGIAAGSTTLVVERRTADGFLSQSDPLAFTVTAPSVATVSPSSAPIGAAFTLTGTSFGNYAGANTRVLFDGTTSPIAVWNDHTIVGTVPGGLAPGAHELVVERRASGGGVSRSGGDVFIVQGLALAAVYPTTGAIGVPFTLTGGGFGAYLGANSRVKFGVSTAAVSVWTDGSISGTIPTLATGAYAVTVERQQGADVSVSNPSTFTVIELAVASVAPSSGPIGTAVTLTGAGFGPYGGANTFLLLGGATTPISVWNDAAITATVPGLLSPGVKELVAVRRNADGGLSISNTVYFEVTGMGIASLSPSSGPIGVPFTIKGSQFGVYLGANSRVRFGVSTAAVSVWNDTTITGTIPALSTGVHPVVLERQQGTEVALSDYSSFTVTELTVGTLTPSSGPIGVAFTITGAHFGPYGGANTRLLIGGTTAAVSVWNDTTITGSVPNLAAGSQPLWLERKSGSGVQSSATAYFLVTTPAVAALVPSSAPIGAPFTITGSNFGPYAGANTRVKFNGVSAPVSVWNTTTISGTVPGAVSTGPAVVVVERAAGAGVSSSAEQAFEVLRPIVSTVSPSFGPVGTVVTLTGRGFGPYAGTATRLLVGGSTVTVSVWNDSTIRWTVPAGFSDGEYPLVARRTPAGGIIESEPAFFTVGAGYGGSSFGFTETLSLAAQPDVNFEGGLNLPVDEGGRVETASKAAVEVPPSALEEDTEITLKRLRKDGLRTEAAAADKKSAAGEAIEFGPEGTQFNAPVTIELPYDPALTADESKLAVHYFDPLRRAWEELPSVVDRARRVVRAQTTHFSIYQPMGTAPATAAQDEFYYRDQYAFPNPSRDGATVTFRIQPGLADTVEVRVYDLSGRRIHSSTDFTFRGPIDDLNGKGAQNTYDHVWSVSGVGSGVYKYVIKASRAGQTPIVKSGKVGVIK